MNIQNCAALLLAVVFLFAGCSVQRMDQGLETVENAVENKIDAVEDAIIHSVTPAAETPAPASMTGQEAEAIALEHAGLTEDQVSRLRSEYDIDDGVAHYDVEFNEGYWEYDYEIHAETGKILSFDKDD